MSELAFDHVSLPAAACRLTVAIPARDEERLLGNALQALSEQRAADGSPLPPGTFDVIVLANNCRDATAAVADAFAAAHPEIPTFTLSVELAPAQAHVGTARKRVLDLAAARFMAVGRPRGIVATTDADTVVDRGWVAATLHEAATVDAIAGHVTIAETELATLLVPARLLYSRERAYRRAFAELSAALDPLPHDPSPRHASFVGASFAVAADTYLAAGGLPPLALLEDRTFYEALCRIDARVRHSLLVRAQTSARRAARVEGGFGAFVAELCDRGTAGETFFVQHPRATLDEIELRASLRNLWRGSAARFDVARATRILRVPAKRWLPLVEASGAFGAVSEIVRAAGRICRYEPVPVECATVALRVATAAWNAPSATRMRTASGAG